MSDLSVPDFCRLYCGCCFEPLGDDDRFVALSTPTYLGDPYPLHAFVHEGCIDEWHALNVLASGGEGS